MRVRTLIVLLLMIVVAGAGCGSKKTSIQGVTGGELDNNGFPTSAVAQTKLQAYEDAVADWGFYTGAKPGITPPSIDFTKVWVAPLNATNQAQVTEIQNLVPCGPNGQDLVVCPTGNPGFAPSPLLLFSLKFAGNVPTALPQPETARYSILFDFGGDEKTKSKPSQNSPDLASAGMNGAITVIFNDPGITSTMGPNVSIFGSDRTRKNEFFPLTSRALFHNDFVTFIVPIADLNANFQADLAKLGPAPEIPEDIIWRASAFKAVDVKKQGDPGSGAHDVVVGDVHAPYSNIETKLELKWEFGPAQPPK